MMNIHRGTLRPTTLEKSFCTALFRYSRKLNFSSFLERIPWLRMKPDSIRQNSASVMTLRRKWRPQHIKNSRVLGPKPRSFVGLYKASLETKGCTPSMLYLSLIVGQIVYCQTELFKNSALQQFPWLCWRPFEFKKQTEQETIKATSSNILPYRNPCVCIEVRIQGQNAIVLQDLPHSCCKFRLDTPPSPGLWPHNFNTSWQEWYIWRGWTASGYWRTRASSFAYESKMINQWTTLINGSSLQRAFQYWNAMSSQSLICLVWKNKLP